MASTAAADAVTAAAEKHFVQTQRRIHKHWLTDETWQLVKPVAKLRDGNHARRVKVGECRMRIAFKIFDMLAMIVTTDIRFVFWSARR